MSQVYVDDPVKMYLKEIGNIPLLLRRTKMHESVLGKEYPLYVESTEECAEKILDFFKF